MAKHTKEDQGKFEFDFRALYNTWKQVRELPDKTYRYYEKLTESQTNEISLLSEKRGTLWPQELLFILKLYKVGFGFHQAIKYFTDGKMEEYLEWVGSREEGYFLFKPLSLKEVKRELEFRGFYRESKLPLVMNRKFDYITTNIMIDNEYWIFPMAIEGNPETYLPLLGIEGYCRILYSENR